MRINLPSGEKLDLDKLIHLGIKPSAKKFHRYNADSVVGFTEGNFSAWNLVDIPISVKPTTMDNAFLALLHKPAPSWELMIKQGEIITHGSKSEVALLGTVSHYVFPEHRMIVNITEPDHILHPGIVVRYVSEVNGQITIITEGVGVGDFAIANTILDDVVWGAVDHDVQQLINSFGTDPIPQKFESWFR